MTQEYIPFPHIVEEIKKIHLKKESGIFFISTDSNRSAQVVIKSGVISFVYYFNKQGMDALKLMVEIEAGRYRFQQGQTLSKTNALPSTPDILAMLAKADVDDSIPVLEPDINLDTQGNVAIDCIDDSKIEHLKKILGKITGPAGSFLIDDAMQEMGLHVTAIPVDSFEEVVKTIASKIPGNKQQEMFKNEMTEHI